MLYNCLSCDAWVGPTMTKCPNVQDNTQVMHVGGSWEKTWSRKGATGNFPASVGGSRRNYEKMNGRYFKLINDDTCGQIDIMLY